MAWASWHAVGSRLFCGHGLPLCAVPPAAAPQLGVGPHSHNGEPAGLGVCFVQRMMSPSSFRNPKQLVCIRLLNLSGQQPHMPGTHCMQPFNDWQQDVLTTCCCTCCCCCCCWPRTPPPHTHTYTDTRLALPLLLAVVVLLMLRPPRQLEVLVVWRGCCRGLVGWAVG